MNTIPQTFSQLTLDELDSMVREGIFEARLVNFNKKGERTEFSWQPARMLEREELPFSLDYFVVTRWDLDAPIKEETAEGFILDMGKTFQIEFRVAEKE